MKKILVFGASGDTGTYFVRYFLDHYNDSEYEVVAVGTRETDRFARMGVPYYRVDITQKNAFDCLPKDIYAVVDLAGAMPARMKGCEYHRHSEYSGILPKNRSGSHPVRTKLWRHQGPCRERPAVDCRFAKKIQL